MMQEYTLQCECCIVHRKRLSTEPFNQTRKEEGLEICADRAFAFLDFELERSWIIALSVLGISLLLSGLIVGTVFLPFFVVNDLI